MTPTVAPPPAPPARSAAQREPSALQRRVFDLLDGHPTVGDPLDVACYWILLAAIVIAVVAMVAATVPAVAARFGAELDALDLTLGVVFAVEYLARLWAAPADPRYADGWRGRWRFVRSPLAVLDLVAVVALLAPHLLLDLRQVRLIRLFVLLRVSKLGRFSRSLTVAGRIFRSRRDELILALGAVGLLLFVGSSLVYFAEHDAQPEQFGSIPQALWWGVATVTTVGYGDVVPVTTLGRVLGGVLAVLGIASFALPTAILGAAFLDELQRERALAGRTTCPTCGQPCADHPAPG